MNMDRPTDFARSPAALEEFMLACVCVAGKNAHVQAARLDRLLRGDPRYADHTPFDAVRSMLADRALRENLVRVGMGKYALLMASFRALVGPGGPDPRTAPIHALVRVPGFQRKTASFFVLHSRPAQAVAVLDTHVHKMLTAEGFRPPPFPPASPAVYSFWESTVLALARRDGLAPAEFDIRTWLRFRRPPGGDRGGHLRPVDRDARRGHDS